MLNIGWDWDRIPFDFPLEIKLMFQAIPIPLIGRGSDRLAWVNNPRGDFNLKSAYSLAMGPDPNMAFSANWIWKSMMLPRIKTFLWQCALKSIGVKVSYAKRDDK